MRTWLIVALTVVLGLSLFEPSSEARGRKKQYRTKTTHPLFLWSKTLSDSSDLEERRVAAFKLSQYSQPIRHSNTITNLLHCLSNETDVQLKVFCTKALGNTENTKEENKIRALLLDRFENDPAIRATVVRALIRREDDSPATHDALLKALPKVSSQPTDSLTVLDYFEKYGKGDVSFIQDLSKVFNAESDSRVRRAIIKVISERGKGQKTLIVQLSKCATSSDTPLALTCLAGLESQAKDMPETWVALEKTIQSDDPDVLEATVDVIAVLESRTDERIASRLVDIISNDEDPALQEKSILALGSTGNLTETIVEKLINLMDSEQEAIQIASALALGQQGAVHTNKALPKLNECAKQGKTQSLRTACSLGVKDLEQRKKTMRETASKVVEAQPPEGVSESTPSSNEKKAD